MTGSTVTTLAEGKLYALQNAYELDGRVSSYPVSARGFTASNCYLIKQEDGALLLDTGYPVHEGAILGQLGSLIDPKLPLSLFPLRLNEFMSVCNAGAIAERFNVVQCYSPVPNVALWVDFSAESLNGQGNGKGNGKAAPKLRTTIVSGAVQQLQVGESGKRPIEAIQAPIRLIGTRWSYDAATRTLFSSDMFTHVWRDDADGPWIVDAAGDTTTLEELRSFLLNTRYWWLEGAKTDALRRGLAELFEKYDIETIAPGYGCILRGRKVVERQYQMLDNVLRKLDKGAVRPAYVPRGLER